MIPMIPALLLSSAAVPATGFGSHIGWRIAVTSNMGGTTARTSAGQIEFRDSGGVTISTSGATIFEGGTGAVNSPASNAFDGTPTVGSPWSRTVTAGGNGVLIGAVWGTPKAVAGFKMWSPPAGWGGLDTETIMSGKLQYSDDTTTGINGTWTDAFTFWEPSFHATIQTSRIWPQDTSGGKYKAFAWFPTLSNDGAHMAMDECELFIGGGAVDQIDSSNCHSIASAGVSNPGNLSDNSTANWTELGATNRYCGVALPDPIKITGYSLGKYQWLTEAWKNWTLKGTNDGTTFTLVDTQVNQSWAVASKKSYSV
jgi:hypothetical protein